MKIALTTLFLYVLCMARVCGAAAHAGCRPLFETPNDFGIGPGLAKLAAKAGAGWREVAEKSRTTGLERLRGEDLVLALQEMSRRYYGSDALDMAKVPSAEIGEIAEAALRGGMRTEAYGWGLLRWFFTTGARIPDSEAAARLLAGFERGLAGVVPDDARGESVTFSPLWKVTPFQTGLYRTMLPGGGYFDSAWSNSMGSCSYNLKTSAKKVECRIALQLGIRIYNVMVNGLDVDFNGGAFTAFPDSDGAAEIRIDYLWSGSPKKKNPTKESAK